MSQQNIEIIDVEFTTPPTKNGKGTYDLLTVTFRNEEGKVDQKKVLGFATPPEAFLKLRQAKKGDTFAIEREKNAAGYWDWKDVSTQQAAVGPAAAGKAPPYTKPQYETAEERGARQVYIIKQSSIGHAVALLAGKEASPEDVIKVADKFVAYVLGERIQDMADDIPD